MPESVSSDELLQAHQEVEALYRRGLETHLAGGKNFQETSTDIPSPKWVELADKHPKLRDTILKLGEAVTEAEFDRQFNPFPETETYRQLYFNSNGGDNYRLGQFLLTDIFQYRVKRSQHNGYPGRSLLLEAHILLREYGCEEGLLTDPSHPIAFLSVVNKVLSGDINLAVPRQRRR